MQSVTTFAHYIDGYRTYYPPRRGICLRPAEYVNLKSHVSKLEKEVPQLETIVPCFMRDDHQNQLGMFRCPTYNPLEYENW